LVRNFDVNSLETSLQTVGQLLPPSRANSGRIEDMSGNEKAVAEEAKKKMLEISIVSRVSEIA
jgi:hypothetical protein